MYIYTQEIFPIGTRLELEVDLGPHNKPAIINGFVVWIADKEIQPHSYPGMGVQFAKLNDNIQKNIIDFINKHVTHRSGLYDNLL